MSSVYEGDCRDWLRTLETSSADSVVCDPPYELGFMGRKWDSSGVAYDVDLWREVLRVLKPGGHLLAFGGTRTYHRMTCAIEDAGFEIRDSIHWVFGSGFPKSLDVSKALDKAAGVERDDKFGGAFGRRCGPTGNKKCEACGKWLVSGSPCRCPRPQDEPKTESARRWRGWGTALKPAHEPCVVARKPLDGTVAANVLAHGVGALNVDGCRIPHASAEDLATSQQKNPGRSDLLTSGIYGADRPQQRVDANGRWPANIVFDEDAARELDEQSNGASRFFYCAKASRMDRESGLHGMPKRIVGTLAGGGSSASDPVSLRFTKEAANTHPTVKPTSLMRWLVRLVTPPGGLVLDPFAGSGSTGVAAVLEGFRFAGAEKEPEHAQIARARIEAAVRMKGAA